MLALSCRALVISTHFIYQLALSLCVDFVMSGVGFIPLCYHLALSSCVDFVMLGVGVIPHFISSPGFVLMC